MLYIVLAHLMLFAALSNNNNNNGYFKVLFLQRAHSPFIYKKQKQQQRCEHRIRKNKQIKSTVHDVNKKMK